MILQGIIGLVLFTLFAWVISENRRKALSKDVLIGVGFQLALALILLKVTFFQDLFLSLNWVIWALEESTKAGTSMVFGYLGGGDLPFTEEPSGSSFILAFRALPLVLLISALSSLLFYWKVLPLVVRGFSRLLQRTMHLGGAEGVGVAANVFLGMVESPLFVRPYLARMTRSEIFTIMTCGMSTIAGTVMVLYASILSDVVPNVMGQILTASIISAPAAVTISKLMIPETGQLTSGELRPPDESHSAMDAVTKGTIQGVSLLINIIAMLVVLVAMVHLVNLLLGLLPAWGGQPLTLQWLLGNLMAPLMWLMGVPWSEAQISGQLMGTKTILNELVAYLDMGQLPAGALSERTSIIVTYALCGFANPGSLGIMIGGMGTMVPERRHEIVSLGLKSIVAGTLVKCMTGAIVGLLI
jgi:CNT family concentrative nucleoside transporter